MVISESLQNNKDISSTMEFLKSQHLDRCITLFGEYDVMERNSTKTNELV
jgi:hypothetical protein